MGIEQYLVRLQEIGADNDGAAVAKLGMRGLQLGPLAAVWSDDALASSPKRTRSRAGACRDVAALKARQHSLRQ
jgi:hypothetical protein